MTPPQLSFRRLSFSTLVFLLIVGVILIVGQAQRVGQYLSMLSVSDSLELLGLGTLGLSEVLVPSASFVAVIYVFRHAWRGGFFVTFFSCGKTPWQLSFGLGLLIFGVTAFTGVLSHSVGPSALSLLKGRFVQAFEAGNVHPITSFPVGAKGGLEIRAPNGEVLGAFRHANTLTMVHANETHFREEDGEKKLSFRDVRAANQFMSLETEQLTITMHTSSFFAFPRVLRGTKLLISEDLTLSEVTHQYTYWRRWMLTLLVVPLLLSASVLPRFFGDIGLAIVSALFLASVHIVLRLFELSGLGGVPLLISMALCLMSTYLWAVYLWWRAYWRI